MKLNKLSLAVVASLASSAALASPGVHDVYLSSATALRDTMVRMVSQHCDPAFPMKITERTATKNNLATAGDKDFRAYECTFKSSAVIPALANSNHDLGGASMRIYHTVKVNSALGGSIVGVMPIYKDIEMEFVQTGANDGVNCAANGTEVIAGVTWTKAKCKNSFGKRPEVGVSDTEPASFNGPNLSTAGFDATTPALDEPQEPGLWSSALTQTETNTGTSAPFIIVGFGLALTNDLFNHASKPIKNLSHVQIASILSGNVDNWSEVGGPNVPVKICRRTPGSGTQASWNAMANDNPCKANSFPFGFLPIAQFDTVGPHEGALAGHDLTVSENSASSGVKTCLTGSTHAIGLLSLENNESNTTKNWQFVALDGVQPFDETETLAQPDGVVDRIREEFLTSGAYNYIQEPTIQWLNTLAGHPLAFGEVLRDNAGHPDITKNLPGVVSLPNYTFATGLSCDLPTSGISSVTRGGNSCQTATRSPVCGL